MKIIIFGINETSYLVANAFYQNHDITIMDDIEELPANFEKLDIKFVVGADPDDQSPQREKYYYKTSDTKKDITSDEFMAYFNDTVSFEWTKIDSE